MDWCRKRSGSSSTLNSLSLASLLKLWSTMNASSSQVCSHTRTFFFLQVLLCMALINEPVEHV